MANYTIDGARIDVGTRKFPVEKGLQMLGTTYVRVVGAGSYGQDNFQVRLELAEVIKPQSEFLPTDSGKEEGGRKKIGQNEVRVIVQADLTGATLSVEQCRSFCDEIFDMRFLMGEKGQAQVSALLEGDAYSSYYQAYLYQVKPPEHKIVALVESKDNKTMLLRGDTGKLVLPMASRLDKSEPLMSGLSKCFLDCAASVRDLQLSCTCDYPHLVVPGLRDHFRVVTAVSYLSSEALSRTDADLVGVVLPQDETVWDPRVEKDIEANSLRIIKAFYEREQRRIAERDGGVVPQLS